jgi:hypothetical protein
VDKSAAAGVNVGPLRNIVDLVVDNDPAIVLVGVLGHVGAREGPQSLRFSLNIRSGGGGHMGVIGVRPAGVKRRRPCGREEEGSGGGGPTKRPRQRRAASHFSFFSIDLLFENLFD